LLVALTTKYPPPPLTISNSTVASAPTNETINPKEDFECYSPAHINSVKMKIMQ
jgi:hypothetical protein